MNNGFRNLFICLLLLLASARVVIGEIESPEPEALPLDELRTFTEILQNKK